MICSAQEKKKKNHTHKGRQILVLLKFPEHRKRKQDRGQFHTTHLQALSSAEAPSPPLQSTCRGKLFCKDHSDQIMFVRVPETVIYIKFLFLPPPLKDELSGLPSYKRCLNGDGENITITSRAILEGVRLPTAVSWDVKSRNLLYPRACFS